jgi:hypothetical protein
VHRYNANVARHQTYGAECNRRHARDTHAIAMGPTATVNAPDSRAHRSNDCEASRDSAICHAISRQKRLTNAALTRNVRARTSAARQRDALKATATRTSGLLRVRVYRAVNTATHIALQNARGGRHHRRTCVDIRVQGVQSRNRTTPHIGESGVTKITSRHSRSGGRSIRDDAHTRRGNAPHRGHRPVAWSQPADEWSTVRRS